MFQFVVPDLVFLGDIGQAARVWLPCGLVCLNGGQQFRRKLLDVCTGGYIDAPAQAQHFGIPVDLNDFGLGGPVIDVILGQGSEGAQATTQGDDHIGFGNGSHGSLGTTVADGA